RLLQHALDVADHHVLRERRRLQRAPERPGEDAAEETGDVAVLAHETEAGAFDPGPQAPYRDRLEDVVLLLLPLFGEGDEGIRLLRFLQRPGGVPRQPAERRERDSPAHEQVEGN